MSKRIRYGFVVVLALALVGGLGVLPGCGGGGDTAGGTFNFYISEPAFIDPVNLQESEGTQVGQAVFDSLVAFDPITSEVVPAAAATWESNDDASVWTFHLVEGATFQDGTPVKAADFKYAWERICNPENLSEVSYHLAAVQGYDEMQAGTATELSGVKVVDDYTLEVTLVQSFGDFIFVVGHPALAPVPQALVENGVTYTDASGAEKTAEFSEMPVGNGPFMLTEPWAHDQYVECVAYEDYYGEDKPNIDGIHYAIIADEDTAYNEFAAGNLDFVSIPSGQIEAAVTQYGESADGYTANPGTQVLLGAEQSIYYIVVNNTDNVMSNKKVREAVSLAIDRQEICDKVFEGTRVPATGVTPPGIVGYEENTFPAATYDVEAAKAALAEAGYANGEGLGTITYSYNTENPGHAAIAELVQADLAEIGVTVELSGSEWATYLDILGAGNYQIGRLGWQADYPIMDNFLYPLFKTGSADNYSKYSNSEVDSLLDEARKTADTDERVAMYQQVEQIVGEETVVIPLLYYRHTRVASDRVENGVFSPNGLFDFVHVSLVTEAAE